MVFSARGIYQKSEDSFPMQERVKRISAFEKATQMEVLRRDEAESSEILEKPFLAPSMPSNKSPKLTGAGMQFRNVSNNFFVILNDDRWTFFLRFLQIFNAQPNYFEWDFTYLS